MEIDDDTSEGARRDFVPKGEDRDDEPEDEEEDRNKVIIITHPEGPMDGPEDEDREDGPKGEDREDEPEDGSRRKAGHFFHPRGLMGSRFENRLPEDRGSEPEEGRRFMKINH